MTETLLSKDFYGPRFTQLDSPLPLPEESLAALEHLKETVLASNDVQFAGMEKLEEAESANQVLERPDPSKNSIMDIVGQHFKEQDFEIGNVLNRAAGPAVEVAGPSSSGFPLLERQLEWSVDAFTSNIASEVQECMGSRIHQLTGLDFVADAQKLPLKAGSVGLLMAAHIPKENALREGILKEAYRVLEGGGLLAWVGSLAEVQHAEEIGLTVREAYLVNFFKQQANTVHTEAHLIFQKPISDK